MRRGTIQQLMPFSCQFGDCKALYCSRDINSTVKCPGLFLFVEVVRVTSASGCVEEFDEEDYEGDEDDEEKPRIGARPQRLQHITTKVKPIPPASSLFIFSSTNPYESIFALVLLLQCYFSFCTPADKFFDKIINSGDSSGFRCYMMSTRSTQPSTLPGTVKWVSAFGLNNNKRSK